jgi:hypothetical protein
VKNPSYLPIFDNLREHCKGGYELTGDRLLVERLITDDEVTKTLTTEDGRKIELVLSSGGTEKARIDGIKLGAAIFVRVLESGKGYVHQGANGEEYTPLDTKPGNILLVAGIESVKWWNNIFNLVQIGEHAIGVMAEDQILMRWNDDTAFQDYIRITRLGLHDGKGNHQ